MIDSSLALMVCGSGVTFFLIHSERGLPIRKVLFQVEYFERMFACAFCTGYWVGLLVGIAHSTIDLTNAGNTINLFLLVEIVFYTVLLGMGTGIVSIVMDRLIDLGDAAVHGVSMVHSFIPDSDSSTPSKLQPLDEEDTAPTVSVSHSYLE